MELLKRLLGEEDGQDAVEYVIIVAMISIVAIVLVGVVGDQVQTTWTGVSNQI